MTNINTHFNTHKAKGDGMKEYRKNSSLNQDLKVFLRVIHERVHKN